MNKIFTLCFYTFILFYFNANSVLAFVSPVMPSTLGECFLEGMPTEIAWESYEICEEEEAFLMPMPVNCNPDPDGTIWVTTTADNGDDINPVAGSLREAILCANSDTEANTIKFNLTGTAPFLFQPSITYPPLTDSLTVIDGTTQANWGAGDIELMGGGSIDTGIAIQGDNCEIYGLYIHGFNDYGISVNSCTGCKIGAENKGNVISGNGNNGSNDAGIYIHSSSDSITIEGNKIGTTLDGSGAMMNNRHGIYIVGSTNTTIRDNLISGNGNQGILLNSGANNTTIENNTIGLNKDGNAFLGHQDDGIYVHTSSGTEIKSNLISGNGNQGIYLTSGANNTTIENNKIGTDSTGVSAVPNLDHGIYIQTSTEALIKDNLISGNGDDGIFLNSGANNALIENNKIGPNITGNEFLTISIQNNGITIHNSIVTKIKDNLISGNTTDGIWLNNSADSTIIEGNKIGTNASGDAAIPNGHDGIDVNNSSSTTIRDNLVSGNHNVGIEMNNIGDNNFIENNTIGTDSTGMISLENQDVGIHLSSSSGTTINNNLISGNNDYGIYLYTSVSNTTITANKIGINGTGTGVVTYLNTNSVQNNGIYIASHSGNTNTIIGNQTATGSNIIAYNNYGMYTANNSSNTYAIRQNSIFCNTNEGIFTYLISSPTITQATSNAISGTSVVNDTIEVFLQDDTGCSEGECQGKTYLGTVITDASGDWSLSSFTQTLTVGQQVVATATNGNYTSEFSDCKEICASISPIISGNQAFCEGGVITLGTLDSYSSYHWSIGNTASSVNITQGGVYTVTVTDNAACIGTASVVVTIHSLPTVTANNDSPACSGDPVNLSTISGMTTYAWSGPGGYTNATQNPTIALAIAGTYTVTVTDGNGCTNTATTNVIINPLPTATATNNGPVCEGDVIHLSASGGDDYIWSDSGNTLSSFTIFPSNIGMSGIYTVTVTDGNGCTNTAETTVTVHPLPTATASNDSPGCIGGIITLTGTGGGTYVWSANTTGTGSSVTVITAGIYTVTVTDENSCTSTATTQVTVNPLPNPTIEGDEICIGDTATISASGGTDYLWSNGDTGSIISDNPTSSTIYTVTVTDGNNCSATSTTQVTVNPLPAATASNNSPVCEGTNVRLTATGGEPYVWSTGATTQTTSVISAGIYTVTVTDGNNCSTTASTQVTINPLPTATASNNSPICEGGSSILTAGGGNAYIWSIGTSPSTGSSVTATDAGIYTVTVTNANNCISTATTQVTVNPLPSVEIMGDDYLNNPTIPLTTSVQPQTGTYNYTWSNGETSASISVSSIGTYTVTVQDVNACTVVGEKTIDSNNNCNATINPTTIDICEGDTTTLTAIGTSAFAVQSYDWSNGGTSQSIEVTPNTSTIYTVTVTNTEDCTSTAITQIIVNPLPSPIAEGDEICIGDIATISA
ncbi:MAG: right-handed parallel beta-helix repeat-containing protein, partial [Chitinophagales bacterium]